MGLTSLALFLPCLLSQSFINFSGGYVTIECFINSYHPLPIIQNIIIIIDEAPNAHVHSRIRKGRQSHLSSFKQPCILSDQSVCSYCRGTLAPNRSPHQSCHPLSRTPKSSIPCHSILVAKYRLAYGLALTLLQRLYETCHRPTGSTKPLTGSKLLCEGQNTLGSTQLPVGRQSPTTDAHKHRRM